MTAMASSCRWRWLNSMAALAVILAPAMTDADTHMMTDADTHRLIKEYKECSIMILRRAPTTTDPPCPARHYCNGGQSLCFPCSTCNGSDCRRMTYEPQCANSFPFAYQMSAGKPQYTPACSLASLLRTSASGSDSKATAEVKVESCEPGCDNLGINGSERCFPGTSCKLACGNNSVIAESWTALCNCSYLGNLAMCDWIQIPAVCAPAGNQLPTATAEPSVSERSPKGVERQKSMRGITYALDNAGDTSSPDEFAGRSRAAVGQLDSLTKRTETGSSGGQEFFATAVPILFFLLIFVVAVLRSRGDLKILNISNVRNEQTIICNTAPDAIVTNDVSESPADFLSDNSDTLGHMTDRETASFRSSCISVRGVRQLHGNGASLAAADAPEDAQLLMANATQDNNRDENSCLVYPYRQQAPLFHTKERSREAIDAGEPK